MANKKNPDRVNKDIMVRVRVNADERERFTKMAEYFMLRKALNRTKESTISLHGKHQRATRKALAI